ncbi:thioesterase family protein [Aspergillus undulatus]|uniref:thioesterase family protein n=1 Tax=Aspergillus undulatus TaxID=1810928 RepID=UPI003CCD35DD
MNPRRPKQAGRPLLDASNDGTLSGARRAQVRRAQRTYRQRKEAVFKNATARADRLEARMRSVNEALSQLSETAEDVQLHLSHPDIYARLVQLRGLLADGQKSNKMHSSSEAPSPGPSSVRGPVSNTLLQSANECSPTSPIQSRQYTYAFQESSFARQLQRYCLEHAYRLFTDSRSDPHEMYRVFRLVPCIRDPSETEPRFRQLLMGGRADALELVGLPFYCVGGAGTHFPQLDEEGNPIHPVNSRLPRRILGIAPCAEPERMQALAAYGFGGEWFDCHDVEGYLRQQGLDLTGELFPALHIASGAVEGDSNQSFVLDAERFFSRLLSGFAILGRAPGFRRRDVRRALQTSTLSGNGNSTNTVSMPSLKEQIAVEQIDNDCYRSVVPPIRMGELGDWAYGGNTLAIAVKAAYATVTPGQHLYFISGQFVRPATLSQKLICRVERIRDTRTFQTRHLRIVQSGGESEQICLIATADFQINQLADMVMVNYSARPQLPVPSAPAAETATEKTKEPALYSILNTMMAVHPHAADRGREGTVGVPQIVSAERFQLNEARLLQTEADRIAALAFYMDRGLAYIPANHSGYSLAHASVCATLDFALRLLTDEVNLQNWHASERQTCGAGNARALSEGKVFDTDGRLLASMTQTTILRLRKGASKI